MTGHAYAILDTTRLKVGNDRIEMVKLRNPWAKAGIQGRLIFSPTVKIPKSENDRVRISLGKGRMDRSMVTDKSNVE